MSDLPKEYAVLYCRTADTVPLARELFERLLRLHAAAQAAQQEVAGLADAADLAKRVYDLLVLGQREAEDAYANSAEMYVPLSEAQYMALVAEAEELGRGAFPDDLFDALLRDRFWNDPEVRRYFARLIEKHGTAAPAEEPPA